MHAGDRSIPPEKGIERMIGKNLLDRTISVTLMQLITKRRRRSDLKRESTRCKKRKKLANHSTFCLPIRLFAGLCNEKKHKTTLIFIKQLQQEAMAVRHIAPTKQQTK
jgi:hypothetical protein